MRKKNRITAFYAENFKAINKGTWFELNDLNILTGANNSGKSTLFKAMKIFTEGFVNGDFPLIELEKIIPGSGYFNDILNFNSKQKYFKVGFRYYSDTFKAEFEVIYQFVQGENAGEARFASMQVNKEAKPVLELFHGNIIDDYRKEYDFHKISFTSILEGSNPGQIIFSINLQTLRMLLPTEKYLEHEAVFDILKRQFSDQWVGELLDEEKFNTFNLVAYSRISEELFYDFYHDYYCNLYNFNDKYPIFHDADEGESENEYRKKCSQIGFKDFIKDCFNDLFDEISAQIRFFYNKRLFHVELRDAFYSRVIPLNAVSFKIPVIGESEKLEKYFSDHYPELAGKRTELKESSTETAFSRWYFPSAMEDTYHANFWLRIFGFEGYIITEELDNTAYRVYFYDSKKKMKISIADLGKGHAHLIQFLLALAFKIFIHSEYDPKKSDAEQRQNIIHLEEPEAFMHPAWQSKLADLMQILSKKFDVQFLIETHSVYLIQKLQLLVAQGKIEPDKVSLLYFEDIKKGIKFRRITIRKDGMLKEGFGPGFYDESAMLSIDLLNAQNPN